MTRQMMKERRQLGPTGANRNAFTYGQGLGERFPQEFEQGDIGRQRPLHLRLQCRQLRAGCFCASTHSTYIIQRRSAIIQFCTVDERQMDTGSREVKGRILRSCMYYNQSLTQQAKTTTTTTTILGRPVLRRTVTLQTLRRKRGFVPTNSSSCRPNECSVYTARASSSSTASA